MKSKIISLVIIAITALIGFSFVSCGGGGDQATVTRVFILPGDQNMIKGGTLEYFSHVYGENNPSQAVTWSIETPGTKTGTTIDSTGKLTIAVDEVIEWITIRATSDVDTSKYGQSVIMNIYNSIHDINVPALIHNDWYEKDHIYWFDLYREWIGDIEDESDLLDDPELLAAAMFIMSNYTLFNNTSRQMWSYLNGLPVFHTINISNWPQEQNNNNNVIGMHYRKSADGKMMAINPMGRGNGEVYIPYIFVLLDDTQGTFPIGTWLNTDEGIELLIFTENSYTFKTIFNDNDLERNYTMTADRFIAEN